MTARRKVSNEEYEQAYKNKDNRKVIQSVISKYSKVIDRHDLESCGLMALLRCLEYHDDSYNQKFTTSLWRFTDWECKRTLRSKKNKLQCMQLSVIEVDLPEKNQMSDDSKFVKECMTLLPEEDQKILELYYYQSMTMEEIGKLNGYSKETARQKINRGITKLTNIIDKESEE